MGRYFAFIEECQGATAGTILLRGPSKDILQELERNLHDLLGDARSLLLEPRLLPGGGATEISCSLHLEESTASANCNLHAYLAVAEALMCVPRTLAQNAGADPLKIITEVKAKQASTKDAAWGIDGYTGRMHYQASFLASTTIASSTVDAQETTIPANSFNFSAPLADIWEPFAVKSQYIKSAIEAASMLLRVDDIVAAKAPPGPSRPSEPGQEDDQPEH